MTDWDSIAIKIGLPIDWREQGYDSPEYMEQPDSIYQVYSDDYEQKPTGMLKCVWPGCNFRRRSVEAMFRHVHSSRKH